MEGSQQHTPAEPSPPFHSFPDVLQANPAKVPAMPNEFPHPRTQISTPGALPLHFLSRFSSAVASSQDMTDTEGEKWLLLRKNFVMRPFKSF